MFVDDDDMYGGRRYDKRGLAHPAQVNMRMGACGLAVTMRARLRGLLWRKTDDVTLLLAPCSCVHTFGMAHAIDVAFVAHDGRITSVHRGVGRCRLLRGKGAVAVIERFARDGAWFQEGNHVKLDVLSP